MSAIWYSSLKVILPDGSTLENQSGDFPVLFAKSDNVIFFASRMARRLTGRWVNFRTAILPG